MTKQLWAPSKAFADNSELAQYIQWLNKTQNHDFNTYQQVWQWSVDHISDFWKSIFNYFGVKTYSPYQQIVSDEPMPHTKWFSGATLNYAEHIFRNRTEEHPSLIFVPEKGNKVELSWNDLEKQTASLQYYLKSCGLEVGDRVAAYLPNIPEATVGFLASSASGYIWSSVSPDFGTNSVIDRFQQIEPKVLIAADGYTYNGKVFSRLNELNTIVEAIPSIERVILVPFLELDNKIECPKPLIKWEETQTEIRNLEFVPVDFSHPIWVLYSSGTTGAPKAITHSQGGVLLEHLKYLILHNNIKHGDRFFWYSTTGWMMWNYTIASWLGGSTVVLYDGSPSFPKMGRLWELVQDEKITHFGTSAPFIVACMKTGLSPKSDFDLSSLMSIGSTGSPLPPEGFDYVYSHIKEDLWLTSISGGTDVCSAFVGGNPMLFCHKMYGFRVMGKDIIFVKKGM